MLTLKRTVRKQANRLADNLDKVLNPQRINVRKAGLLQQYLKAVLYAEKHGLMLVKFNTKAETIRKWIATGFVFFEGNVSIPLDKVGLRLNAGYR